MNVIIVISSLLDKSQTGINSILENMSRLTDSVILTHIATEIRQFTHSAEIKREIPFCPSVLHA